MPRGLVEGESVLLIIAATWLLSPEDLTHGGITISELTQRTTASRNRQSSQAAAICEALCRSSNSLSNVVALESSNDGLPTPTGVPRRSAVILSGKVKFGEAAPLVADEVVSVEEVEIEAVEVTLGVANSVVYEVVDDLVDEDEEVFGIIDLDVVDDAVHTVEVGCAVGVLV